MLLWLFLASLGPLWLVSLWSTQQQSLGTFDSLQMLTCSQRTPEQIRSAGRPPGRCCLHRHGQPWWKKRQCFILSFYLHIPLTDLDIFPIPWSLTCRFLLICWLVIPRKDWQAPVLQKQPVRKWILYRLAILSTCGQNKELFLTFTSTTYA